MLRVIRFGNAALAGIHLCWWSFLLPLKGVQNFIIEFSYPFDEWCGGNKIGNGIHLSVKVLLELITIGLRICD